MMMNARVEALESRHETTERMLRQERTRPMPDAIVCADLKKRKLQLKDAVAREAS
jgi:hypothetical protein